MNRKNFIYISILIGVIAGIKFIEFYTPIIDIIKSSGFSIQLGKIKISLYELLTGSIFFIAAYIVSNVFIEICVKYIKSLKNLKSTSKQLIINAVQLFIYTISFIITLDLIGVDLTALAVFGGTLGVGIGFGLKNLTSNFISGVLILTESTIEVGDLVKIGDYPTGFIKSVKPTYTELQTFDGAKVIIPNESVFSSPITNWSSLKNIHTLVDFKLSVKISHVDQATEIILNTIKETFDLGDKNKCLINNINNGYAELIISFWNDTTIRENDIAKSNLLHNICKNLSKEKIEIH